MLPVDYESDDYRFNKTLHMDVEVLPDQWNNKFDLQFENGDFKILTGTESLRNAIVIAIMTRYNELKNELYYPGFGCRIHELLKAKKSVVVQKKMVYYCENTLNEMRRIKKVNEITVNDSKDSAWKFELFFNITSINDEIISGSVKL
ncbi:MAG: hypothetical protein K6A34_06085 [Methanobrevibacter sp.]|nr:hypothetical protein [Methanobrevibacter sp.]